MMRYFKVAAALRAPPTSSRSRSKRRSEHHNAGVLPHGRAYRRRSRGDPPHPLDRSFLNSLVGLTAAMGAISKRFCTRLSFVLIEIAIKSCRFLEMERRSTASHSPPA